MKLVVVTGTDEGMLKSDPNTPVVAFTEIEGVIWEGRGKSTDEAKQHLARRLKEKLRYDINIRNPDFEHVRPTRAKGKYDT